MGGNTGRCEGAQR